MHIPMGQFFGRSSLNTWFMRQMSIFFTQVSTYGPPEMPGGANLLILIELNKLA
jgi:hypothetical protein